MSIHMIIFVSHENDRILTVNLSIKQMLGQCSIKPENLPSAEDIKKVEHRVASNEKKIEEDYILYFCVREFILIGMFLLQHQEL